MIRTLQQKIVRCSRRTSRRPGYEARLKVFQECTVTRVLKDEDKVSGTFCYERESGRFFLLEAPSVVLSTGGIGKSFKVTSNSWEYTGDGHALALLAGAPLLNMEFVQFHPTGMVWPPSVKGILVTESVRGDGGVAERAFGPLPEDVQISPRVAPGVFGVGLLEAVPERHGPRPADPGDEDGDGISGRANRVADGRTRRPGRWGASAGRPTCRPSSSRTPARSTATSASRRRSSPTRTASPASAPARARGPAARPEVDERKLAQVTFYTRTLAVPARRDVGAQATDAGERVFARLGCDSCHLPELRTGDSDIAANSHQLIHPYTDLLVHDMGPGLADGRPDGLASGSEWRTAPLWGIGLVSVVNRHTRFLHDGRARNLAEAILWHGGEAHPAREAFRKLPARERRELLAFLESL